MANKRNYQKELDAKIAGLHGEVPTLLLHSCCAPCSSYVLEYLSQYFSITLFYYNPNIFPPCIRFPSAPARTILTGSIN